MQKPSRPKELQLKSFLVPNAPATSTYHDLLSNAGPAMRMQRHASTLPIIDILRCVSKKRSKKCAQLCVFWLLYLTQTKDARKKHKKEPFSFHSEGRGGSFCLHFGPPFGFVFWRTNCRGPGCSFNGSVGAPGWRQVGCAYGIDWGFLLLVLQYIPTCGTKELFQAPNPPPIGLQLGLRSGRALEKTKQKIAKNC